MTDLTRTCAMGPISRQWRAILLACATGCFMCPGLARSDEAAAQAAPVARGALASASGPAPLEFKLGTDILPAGKVQLTNGIEVKASDWPTLVMAEIPTGPLVGSKQKANTCTATLVGPTVLLMAAHCVDDPLTGTVRSAFLRVDGRKLTIKCEIHPAYLLRDPRIFSPRGSEDYALCLIDTENVLPATLGALRFDVVDVDNALQPGEPVLMVGYGCSDLHVVVDELAWTPTDKLLRIGDERIESGATGAGSAPTYAIINSAKGLEPALCPGDSGGPLYSGSTTGDPGAVRRVRAINSMVDLRRRLDGGFDIVSSVAVTGGQTFSKWATSWAAEPLRNGPVICGINRRAGVLPCLN
ncbi:S1 family peptidase [Variovorax sp. LjRoot175]|uniref:trypsin-like serine peptidase n=1 Tax=Variovorax sp. LjRoot175 TaxID=3342276 RepID=UPI003ECDE12D